MDAVNEKILNLWLDMVSLINNQRLVSYLSFNEANICNRLWRQLDQEKDYLTQNELCNETGIEKSLMNRTLRSLEEKGLIERTKNDADRRIVQVKIKKDNDAYLLKVHQKSLAIVDQMITYWGAQNTQKIIESLQLITRAARQVVGNADKQP